MTDITKLDDILKPGHPLPQDEVMISTGLDILNHSAHGQQLVDFARVNNIAVRIMSTPLPTTYLPEPNLAYIGINRAAPISPSRFVLMLAGLLREAQQESAGIKHPQLNAQLDEHIKVSLAKHEDKLWYMCTIACELEDQEAFSAYKFIDELRKMGHDEAMDLYLKQERGK